MTADNDVQFASDLRTVLVKVIKKLRKASPAAQTLSLTERSVMGSLYQHKVLMPSELAAMEMITNQSDIPVMMIKYKCYKLPGFIMDFFL
jgi:hypothetical protein